MAMGKMYVAAKGKNGGYGKGKKVGKTFKTSKVSKSVKNYVKKVVNSNEETKYADSMSAILNTTTSAYVYSPVVLNTMSSSSPTAGAAIFALNQFKEKGDLLGAGHLYNSSSDNGFDQGVDNKNRVGDTVNVSTIQVHGQIDVGDESDNKYLPVEVMVIKEEECADRSDLTLISDLTVLHTQNDRLGFMNMDKLAELKNIKVIKRKTFKPDRSYGQLFPFNMTVKVNKKITYKDDDVSAGLTYKNRYWLLAWIASGNGTAMTIQLQSRMYFKDA